MRNILLLAVLVAAPLQAQEGATVARQVRIPVDQVLGGKIEVSDKERDELKETVRHHKAMEKELRELRKGRGNRFALPNGRTRQPTSVRSLPANSTSY